MKYKIQEIIDIANNMKKSQNTSEHNIAKFIHIELGKLIIYDNTYTAKYENSKNISEKSKKRQQTLLAKKTDASKTEQICKGMAEIYSSILTAVGINSKVYGIQNKGDVKGQKRDDGSKIIILEEYKCNFDEDFLVEHSEEIKNGDNTKHYYSLITIDGKRYISDFLIDSSLFRIKDGEVSLDNEEIPGFCNESDYANRSKNDLKLSPQYLYSLMYKVKNMSDDEKFKYVFDKINSMEDKVGFEESKDLLMTYSKNIFSSDFDFKKIRRMNLVKETDNKVNIVSIYEYNGKYYLLKGGVQEEIDLKNGEVSLEDIKGILKNGFKPRKSEDNIKVLAVLNEKNKENYVITPNQIAQKSIHTFIETKDMAKEVVDKKIYEKKHQQEIELT